MLRAGALLGGIGVLCLLAPRAAAEVRIKDVTHLQGARSNQLVGFGLVVGLDNTGGRSPFTQNVAVDMLQRFGVGATIVNAKRSDNVYKSGNVSAVMVTAELGPYSRKGSHIDVVVSVMDDATSLQGGTLIMTPLKGADGVDYAVAQGEVDVSGFLFAAPGGAGQPLATAQKNHPNVGRIPGGAVVEREVRGEIACRGQLRLLLHHPDFQTARNIAAAINARYPASAVPLDAGTVQVIVPPGYCPRVIEFACEIGLLEISPDMPARVVINARTGTIVAGEHVRVSTAAVAHGNLAIVTNTELQASQPAPFSRGRTSVVPKTSMSVDEQTGPLRVLPKTTTIAELALAMRALGATPRDMIAIFQALKTAGALHAELIIM